MPNAAGAYDAATRRYGPVQPGDTLWSIAKRLIPAPEVTTEQMVLAIRRANPQAFTGSGLGSLRAGVILTIPTRDEALATPRSQAQEEIRRQIGG